MYFSLKCLDIVVGNIFSHVGFRYPFPTVFSTCSKKDLAASLEKGVGMCLFNMPEVKVLYGGQKCGNGYVEEGEQCDCGDLEVRVFCENIFHTDVNNTFPCKQQISHSPLSHES